MDNIYGGLAWETKYMTLSAHAPPANIISTDKQSMTTLQQKGAEAILWETMCLDSIDPYKIHRNGQDPVSCRSAIIIEPATGWFEIIEVPNYIIEELNTKSTQDKIDKTSARISQLFNQTWIQRYPRPNKVIFDNGSEFKKDFVPLLKDFNVKPVPTSIKKPTI